VWSQSCLQPATARPPLIRSGRAHQVRIRLRDDRNAGAGDRVDDRLLTGPHRWPASSKAAYEVYHLGETDAEIREGQDFPKLWARWRYDWSTPGSVTLTIVEADALKPGGFMSLTATPRGEGGSAVHALWDQSSKNLTGLIAVTAMRFVGPRSLSSYYKKVYDNYTPPSRRNP
jgi:hypothetical protein